MINYSISWRSCTSNFLLINMAFIFAHLHGQTDFNVLFVACSYLLPENVALSCKIMATLFCHGEDSLEIFNDKFVIEIERFVAKSVNYGWCLDTLKVTHIDKGSWSFLWNILCLLENKIKPTLKQFLLNLLVCLCNNVTYLCMDYSWLLSLNNANKLTVDLCRNEMFPLHFKHPPTPELLFWSLLENFFLFFQNRSELRFCVHFVRSTLYLEVGSKIVG